MRIGKLYYETEGGERHLLGETEFPDHEGRGEIMEALLNAHWDARLDSASCRPVVEIDDGRRGKA